MSTLCNFVVVSVSCAIAGGSLPAIAVNNPERLPVQVLLSAQTDERERVTYYSPNRAIADSIRLELAPKANPELSLFPSAPELELISKENPQLVASIEGMANTRSSPDPNRIVQLRKPPINAPLSPIQLGGADLLRFLEANPNPLQFPTKPEEVNIETNQRLTLQQVLELARRNNRELQVSELELERAQAQLREARAGLFPTIDLQVELAGGRSTGDELRVEAAREAQRNVPEQLRQDVPDERTTASINSQLAINYNIFTGGRVLAQIRAAQEQVRFNQLDVERLREQTRLDASIAYYDLQQADEQIRISESAVTNAARSLRDAEALFSAGLGTRFDVLRAQVQLARENQNLVRARADKQTRRRDLVRLLSLPQNVDVEAADPVEKVGLWNLALEESIVLAFQNRAELQQQIARRNISRQQRRIARAEQLPQVSLFFNYNLLDEFNDGLGLADGYSIGARLRWNIFDGGASRARVRQQDAAIAIAETRFADTRNQIRFRVEQALFNLRANDANIETARLAEQQAAEALRLAELRQRAGVGTTTEVIDAQNDLTRAQGDRIRAILDYNRALVTLQREISNLPPIQ
jgi:outer membrane protein TolC